MPTRQSILKSIQILRANGVRGGPVRGDKVELRMVVQTWETLLNDVSDPDLERAVMGHLNGDKAAFWPQPGEIRRHLPGAKAAATDTADEAWGVMLRYANAFAWADQSVEKWRQVVPSHINAAAVVAGIRATGGLRVMGSGAEDQMMTHRAAFRSAYRSVAARSVAEREDNVIELALRVGGAHRQLLDGGAG